MINNLSKNLSFADCETDMMMIQQCRVNYLMIFVKRPASHNQQLR
ncbi:MAG: hypothetical protein PHR06_03925 [Candidatus Cloacimonetes bacterium]|nr:hypothetical protein [Candidatus Cloacimonadota bacterium]